MTALVGVLFAVWMLVGVAVLIGRARDRPAWTTASAALGLVPLLVAAELGAWHLGEWSRDLTPLPFFGAVALVTVALERAMARVSVRGLEPALAAPAPIAPWLRGACVAWGVTLALLGRSGLALALAAAMAVLLAVAVATERPPRPDLHPTNQ